MADLDPIKPPFQAKVLDEVGFLSRVWLNYFEQFGLLVMQGAVNLVSGTPGRITVTGPQTAPVINIDPAYVASAAQGGTGQSSYLLGDTLYASGPTAISRLPGTTSTTRRILAQTGTGSASAAPVWDRPVSAQAGIPGRLIRGTTAGDIAAVGGQIILVDGDDLAAVVAAVGGSQAQISICGAITLAANLTYPQNISVTVENGGTLGGAFALTANGPFSAGLNQVFLPGLTVVFGNESVGFALPQWWGARGDGSTDDYAAIVASIASFPVVKLPPAVYITTGRIELPSNFKLIAYGATIKLASGLILNHTNPFRIVYTSGKTGIEIYGLTIDGNKEAYILDVSGIEVYAFGFRADNSTFCHFEDITIQEVPGIAYALYGSNDNRVLSFTFKNFGARRGTNRFENGDGIYMGNNAQRNSFLDGQVYHDYVTGQTESGPTRCGITISSGSYNRFSKIKINNTNRAIQMETDDVVGGLSLNDFEGIDINENPTDSSYYCIIFESKAGYNTAIHDNTFRAINCRGGIGNLGSPSSAVDIALKSYGPLVYNNLLEVIYCGGIFVAGDGFTIINSSVDYVRTEAVGSALCLNKATFSNVEFRGVVSDTTMRFNNYLRLQGCYSRSTFRANHDSPAAVAIFSADGCRWEGSLVGTYALQVGCTSRISNNIFNPTRISGTCWALRLVGSFDHAVSISQFRQTNGVQFGVLVDTGSAQFSGNSFITAYGTRQYDTANGGYYTEETQAITNINALSLPAQRSAYAGNGFVSISTDAAIGGVAWDNRVSVGFRLIQDPADPGRLQFTGTTAGPTLSLEVASGVLLAVLGGATVGTNLLVGGNIELTTAGRGVVYQAGPRDLAGSADPEGLAAATASPGSTYRRTNGTLYLKATGTGNTGWSLLPATAPTSATFSATLTGCTTAPTGTAYYTRFGNTVTLTLPALTATSNTTSMTYTGLPAAIQPAQVQYFTIPALLDNGAFVTLKTDVSVTNTGTMTFQIGDSVTGFTGSGSKGVGHVFTITYQLQ
jgi:hypothetical protein